MPPKRKHDTQDVERVKKPRTEESASNATPRAPEQTAITETLQDDPRATPELQTRPLGLEEPQQESGKGTQPECISDSGASGGPSKTHKIRKLDPPRPFPTVPTSVSATGPRSAHTEGKNYICITRKTKLGAYLRRCKEIFMNDGYRTLHLSALGAAIPHLMQLALSLPEVLPFDRDEIHTEVLTGTVEVQDELIPEDEDEDISYRTRGKSSVSLTIRVGDGKDELVRPPKPRGKGRRVGAGSNRISGGQVAKKVTIQAGPEVEMTTERERIIIREEDMEPS